MRDLPGFGDEATWPPYMGHPNDPRGPSCDDEDGPYPPDVNEESAWILFGFSDQSVAAERLRRLIADCDAWDTPEARKVAADARGFLADIEENS